MNLKEAQDTIDGLSNAFGLPRIQVVAHKHLARAAMFDPDNYGILYTPEATMEDLKHEFGHYVVRLSRAMEEAEEMLCEAFAHGLEG